MVLKITYTPWEDLRWACPEQKKWDDKYHKLVFGKPSFDLFIDDKALFFKDNWYKFIDKGLIVK